MIGVDVDEARAEVRRAASRPAESRGAGGSDRRTPSEQAPAAAARHQLPDLRDPRFSIERETLKLVLQHPAAVGRTTAGVGANDFTHPTYRAVWEASSRGRRAGRRRRRPRLEQRGCATGRPTRRSPRR